MIDFPTYGEVACFFCVAIAVAMAFWNQARPVGAPHAPVSSAAFILAGIGLLCLGSSEFVSAYTSPTVTVEGVIEHLVEAHGKGAYPLFTVVDEAGGYHPVHSNYSGPKLFKGEKVRVTYLTSQISPILKFSEG